MPETQKYSLALDEVQGAALDLAFRSGMTSASDFRGATDAMVPVGVVAGKLTTAQLVLGIPRFLSRGGAIFVDSGAFSAFQKKEPLDFKLVMRNYRFMAEGCEWDGETSTASRVWLVAPDVVGDQAATLELLKRWKNDISFLIESGCKVIVPLQVGELAPPQMLREVSNILGTSSFVAGIPSNLAAMPVELCSTLTHHAFHILGRVADGSDQIARINALRSSSPAAFISADANWLRSRIKSVCTTTDRVRQDRMKHNARGHWRTARASAIESLIKTDYVWDRLVKAV